MAFEQVHAAMEAAESAPAPTETTSPEPSPAEAAAATTETQKEASGLFELEKVGKFKWEGKEWSLDDLKKSVMRHSEWTKKEKQFSNDIRTRDEKLRSYEESRKFDENLDSDLENVRQNPSLAARFKEIYPEKYHRFLDFVVSNQAQGQTNPNQPQFAKLDPNVERRIQESMSLLDSWKQERFDTEVKANGTLLDSACEKFGAKYAMSDLETVLTKAQHLMNQGHFGDPKEPSYNDTFMKTLEDLFKQSHEGHLKRYEAHYQKQIEKQKTANGQAKDIAPGGGTPSRAPAKMKLKDVKNALEEHLGQLRA